MTPTVVQIARHLGNTFEFQVKTHPDSWFAVDTILATSSSADTKFFALNVLENVICTRWMVLPESQKSGIKSLEQTKKCWRVFCTETNYKGMRVPQKWNACFSRIQLKVGHFHLIISRLSNFSIFFLGVVKDGPATVKQRRSCNPDRRLNWLWNGLS